MYIYMFMYTYINIYKYIYIYTWEVLRATLPPEAYTLYLTLQTKPSTRIPQPKTKPLTPNYYSLNPKV